MALSYIPHLFCWIRVENGVMFIPTKDVGWYIRVSGDVGIFFLIVASVLSTSLS
jgi:hypothetical protein